MGLSAAWTSRCWISCFWRHQETTEHPQPQASHFTATNESFHGVGPRACTHCLRPPVTAQRGAQHSAGERVPRELVRVSRCGNSGDAGRASDRNSAPTRRSPVVRGGGGGGTHTSSQKRPSTPLGDGPDMRRLCELFHVDAPSGCETPTKPGRRVAWRGRLVSVARLCGGKPMLRRLDLVEAGRTACQAFREMKDTALRFCYHV